MASTRIEDGTHRDSGSTADEAESVAHGLYLAEAGAIESRPLRRPCSTYRLQVHRAFTLDDVVKVTDYLADLGITDGYLSPYLSARPGTTHGYDIFDHRRMNAEIGDRRAHDRLLNKLRERGMGRVLDIVPNHMGVAGLNPYWVDVLEMGPQSPFACYFDIDWNPIEGDWPGRVLLPILEGLYGDVLESGKILLKREGGRFSVDVSGRDLPVSTRSYATILEHLRGELKEIGDVAEDVLELRSIAASSRSLPSPVETDPTSLERAMVEREVIGRRLARLVRESPRIADHLDRTVEAFRGTPGSGSSFDPLHSLLEQQVYRLAYWRVASEEINYRRFFDINDLAGLRTEDPRVFEASHSRIFRWVVEGGVTGLRIDHPDGLADPSGYFRRIQERLFLKACKARHIAEGRPPSGWPAVGRLVRDRYRRATEGDPRSDLSRRFPVVVEKILTRDETLPDDWTIDGSVGYEFLNAVNGIFVDPESAPSILLTYRDFTGESTRFGEILYDAKRLITRSSLASERNSLARKLAKIAASDRRSRDFTRAELGRAVGSIIACFPVYRTYLQPGAAISRRDRRVIEKAVGRARRRNPTIDASVFEFVRRVLLMDHPEGLTAEDVAARETFAVRFQQTTGPVQAKGLEDTTFYRYVPLLSVNEVGGDPSRFGLAPAAFHAKNRARLKRWPGGFLATATHDTKRGEDARLRINVLSELADDWRAAIGRWSSLNGSKKTETARGPAPDKREEYFFYQTIIGAWPFGMASGEVTPEFVERIQEYMAKAAREAKVNTSWTDADPSHIDALSRFVAEVLTGPDSKPFVDDFLAFQRRIARVGVVHSLAQTLLKLTSPGVPDVYQGCELWDLSLVDPDNRRPVDFGLRASLLAGIKERIDAGEDRSAIGSEFYANPDDGAIKLYLHWAALNHRRDNPDLYQKGQYIPLLADGPDGDRVVAFARRQGEAAVIVVAPRLATPLMGKGGEIRPTGDVWGSTSLVLPDHLGERSWVDLLTGTTHASSGTDLDSRLPLNRLFDQLPCCLLEGRVRPEGPS